MDPASLVAEIDGLAGRGIAIGQNLMLSNRAHVIFPWHIEEDRLAEQQCGGEAIGTTMRGIGPCYRDKFGRGLAVRLGDMYRPDFRARIERIAGVKNRDFRRPWRRRRRETRPAGNLRPVPRLCRAAGAARGRHDGLSARRRRGRQADCCSRAPRARCWTSTTAPSPSSPAATVPAWAFRPVRACPAATSRRSSAWSRPTRRGSAAARSPPSRTTRPASTSAAAATNMAR